MKLTHQRGKVVLSDSELATLLKWLPGSDYTATQKNVLRFTLWTGCRTREVCNAAWKDIDLKKLTFHVRESKMEVERYVQLPSQAVEFLKTLRLTTGDYLFASQKSATHGNRKTIAYRKTKFKEDCNHVINEYKNITKAFNRSADNI